MLLLSIKNYVLNKMMNYFNVFNRLDKIKKEVDIVINLLEKIENDIITNKLNEINKDLYKRIEHISTDYENKLKECKNSNTNYESKIKQLEKVIIDKEKDISKCYTDIKELNNINKEDLEIIEEMKSNNIIHKFRIYQNFRM
jgi:cob(I)alamin adenosyltransferase